MCVLLRAHIPKSRLKRKGARTYCMLCANGKQWCAKVIHIINQTKEKQTFFWKRALRSITPTESVADPLEKLLRTNSQQQRNKETSGTESLRGEWPTWMLYGVQGEECNDAIFCNEYNLPCTKPCIQSICIMMMILMIYMLFYTFLKCGKTFLKCGYRRHRWAQKNS